MPSGGGPSRGFSTSDAKPIPLNSLVEVTISTVDTAFFYTTVAGDTPQGVINGVIADVTQASIPGITATDTGIGLISFTLTAGASLTCKTYGPATVDEDSSLTATVVHNTVNFTGEVDDDYYGIFTNVDAGGTRASCGVFTHPGLGDTLSSIATAIASALNNLPNSVKGPISASASA